MKSCSLSPASKRISISVHGSHVANFRHTACYRHSTSTAPETLPGAYWDSVRHRKRVKKLRHAANQGVQSVNVITGEEASNTDPQLTVHHLNPLSKVCAGGESIHCVLTPYLTKNDVFSTRRDHHASRVYCRRLRMRSVSARGLLCTLFARGTHTPMSSNVGVHLLNYDKLWYGQRPQLGILYRAHSWIVYKCLYFRLNLMAMNTE